MKLGVLWAILGHTAQLAGATEKSHNHGSLLEQDEDAAHSLRATAVVKAWSDGNAKVTLDAGELGIKGIELNPVKADESPLGKQNKGGNAHLEKATNENGLATLTGAPNDVDLVRLTDHPVDGALRTPKSAFFEEDQSTRRKLRPGERHVNNIFARKKSHQNKSGLRGNKGSKGKRSNSNSRKGKKSMKGMVATKGTKHTRTTAQQFIRNSTLADLPDIDNGYTEAADYVVNTANGLDYHVQYNVTLSSQGIVSLNTVKDLIDTVKCSYEGETGTVNIVFAQEMMAPMDSMFPAGSVLAVDSSIYGPCRLSSAGILPYIEDFEDGYLLIEYANGDVSEAVITGTPGSYLDMIPRGSILVEPVASTDDNTHDPSRHRELDSLIFSEDSLALEIGPTTITFKPRVSGFADATIHIRQEWDQAKVDFELELEHEVEFAASLDVGLEVATPLGMEVSKCIPIGTPIGLISTALTGASGGIWGAVTWVQSKIPQLRYDIYAVAEVCAKLAIDLKVTLGMQAEYEFKTGKVVSKFSLKYDPQQKKLIDSHSETPANANPTSDGTFDISTPDVEVELSGSVGLKFSLKGIVSTIFSAGPEFPVDDVAAVKFKGPTPYDPLSLEEVENVVVSLSDEGKAACRSCHHFKFGVSLDPKLTLVAEATIPKPIQRLIDPFAKTKEAFKYKYALFDESFPIYMKCALTRPEMTCAQTCCVPDPNQGVCVLDDSVSPPTGTCQDGSTNPPLTPPGPTDTPTPPPTPEPGDCDTADPEVECCLNSDCDEEGFVCTGKQCVCGQECCSDSDCGDLALFECVENVCRNAVGPPCQNELKLDNGDALSAKITSFLRTSDSVKIGGVTSIGRHDHWTYVIDCSRNSLWGLCGSTDVLTCEKHVVLGLHADIVASGLALDYSVITFASSVRFPFLLTTDRGTQQGSIAAYVNDLDAHRSWEGRPRWGQDFTAALEGAAVTVTASSATNKYVIFLSDGFANRGTSTAFANAVQALKDLGATIFSFAVGTERSFNVGTERIDVPMSCSNDGIYGSLQAMADETGGECKEVTNAADLPDVLTDFVMSKMVNDGLTVDGVSVGATHTIAPPFDGPGDDQLLVTVPASSLAGGSHEACINATGRGPADVVASEQTAGCCLTFT